MHVVIRVVLAGVWLTVGVGLLGRSLLPGEWFVGKDALTLNLMGLVALVLSAYNVLRLVAHLRRQQARARLSAHPIRPASSAPPHEREYIPELDFNNNGPDEAKAEK